MLVRRPEYILALDYGDRRIGVAIAHVVARLPRPLTTLPVTSEVTARIAEIVAAEDVGLVLVGLPRRLDGSYSPQTEAAEAFAHRLSAELKVPVELADETLTSVDAEAALGTGNRDKAAVDALAATYILERYLNEHAKETNA